MGQLRRVDMRCDFRVALECGTAAFLPLAIEAALVRAVVADLVLVNNVT